MAQQAVDTAHYTHLKVYCTLHPPQSTILHTTPTSKYTTHYTHLKVHTTPTSKYRCLLIVQSINSPTSKYCCFGSL
jgi:hypothetical protein